jgi:hypothetical protein
MVGLIFRTAALEVFARGLGRRRRQHVGEVAAEDLLRLVAEHRQPGGVDVGEAAVQVEGVDHVAQPLDQALVVWLLLHDPNISPRRRGG